MDGKHWIAACTVGIGLTLLVACWLLNAVGQWKTTGAYTAEPWMVECIRHIVDVSLAVLGTLGVAGAIAECRGVLKKISGDKSKKLESEDPSGNS
jgi:hypothetical protein